jgi:phage baseplate assembly protein gpV
MNGHLALAEAMRRQGQSPAQAYSMPRQATISSYDMTAHAVKVMLQPENVESNWMPLGAIGVGNGWGICTGPQIGDQVHVSFAEGDFHSGIIVGRVFSTGATPPPVPSGETWMVHQNGTYVKLLGNGDLSINTNRDLLVNAGRDVTVTGARNFAGTFSGYAHITATTEITLSAPVLNLNGTINQTNGLGTGLGTMQGSLTVQGQIKSNTEVVAQTTPLHTHVHTGVSSGASNTGGPTP